MLTAVSRQPSSEMQHGQTFHSAMRPILLLYQVIGVFPVYGITRKDPQDLRFRWLTLRALFSVTIMLIGLVMSVVEYERLTRVGGVNTQSIIGILFYMDTVFSIMLLVMIAQRWKQLVVKFGEIHEVFVVGSSGGEGKKGIHLPIRATKLLHLSFVVLIIIKQTFTVLHVISKAADMVNQYREAKFCGWIVDNFPHYYATRNYSFVLKHVPYNILIVLFFEYLDVALKLAWACHDLMIILTSIGISFYFHEIYEKVQIFGNGIMIANEKFWIEIRFQYVLLCEFVKEANSHLALIIVHSCCKNLYLMCYELIKIVRKEQSTASRIHHWCSLIYLIIKTTMVFHNAAMIYETAKAPLVVCRSIPNKGWCSELERYIAQLRSDKVAYSGIGFFRLTKRTMLAMVGLVVSYQLVMLKVAKDTKGIGAVVPCSRLAFSRD
nr:gustatory receptor for sugar taste 64a-like [Aedes albopictus]